jgi:ribosomal protein L32
MFDHQIQRSSTDKLEKRLAELSCSVSVAGTDLALRIAKELRHRKRFHEPPGTELRLSLSHAPVGWCVSCGEQLKETHVCPRCGHRN